MRLLAPRENMKDKGNPFPNLGANILLEAPTLGANNLFLIFLVQSYNHVKGGLQIDEFSQGFIVQMCSLPEWILQ